VAFWDIGGGLVGRAPFVEMGLMNGLKG